MFKHALDSQTRVRDRFEAIGGLAINAFGLRWTPGTASRKKSLVVPAAGLEPARPFGPEILSLLCLPFHHAGTRRVVRDCPGPLISFVKRGKQRGLPANPLWAARGPRATKTKVVKDAVEKRDTGGLDPSELLLALFQLRQKMPFIQPGIKIQRCAKGQGRLCVSPERGKGKPLSRQSGHMPGRELQRPLEVR